jgi:hypothetical protein
MVKKTHSFFIALSVIFFFIAVITVAWRVYMGAI